MPQYQGVWTLEQQAQAQSNQQWVTDPNFKNTTLLLQADGTGSGSQNQTFLDGSTNNFFITRNGNTTQGSFSPFSQAPGYWSNYFADGSSSYLTLSSGPTFGSGDYTLEFFAYKTTSWTDGFDFLDAATSGLALYVSSGTMAVTKQNVGGTAIVLGSLTSLSPNVWYHFAIVRSSGNVRCYVNGAPLQAAVSDANNYSVATTKICGTGDGYFDGYISNMRLATSALYSIAGSSITIPTSPLTTATGVQYIGSQSNRFVDTTGTQTVAVGGGTPSVQAFSPFAPALQWTPDVVGGSGYFDGSGDYLTTIGTNAALGAGTFTIDGWFYSTGYNTGEAIYSGLNTYPASTGLLFYINGSGTYVVDVNGSNVISAGTAPLNAWTHFALVRSSTGTNGLALYINGVSIATGTSATNFTSTYAVIGRTGFGTASNLWLGYLSGTRIVVGSANVPSGVPTAPPTAITNTALLINYTNAGIYDGTMANNLETVGNAQVATSPVKYGSGSMYFDGNGDYLTSASTQSVAFGTGDFTVEMWVYPTTVSTVAYLYDTRTVNSNPGIQWYINTDATMGGGVGLTNVFTTAAGVMTANQWQHIAISKANGVWRIFRNGILLTSGTNTTAITDTGFTLCTAFNQKTADTTNKYAGFIDDFRITKGVARYIANFTPPQQALPRQ